MKRTCLIALILILMMIGMAGCKKVEKKNDSVENFSKLIRGTHQDEIHRIFGDPSGMLSGFWGDVYRLDNGTKIIIYYDENGEVEHIKVTDKDGLDTLNDD